VPGTDAQYGAEPFFSTEDLISASELREFVFCERAWFLSRQGLAVSADARERREAGIALHQERAGAARTGKRAHALRWAVILVLVALVLWLFKTFAGTQ
jgi:hypothetical protein